MRSRLERSAGCVLLLAMLLGAPVFTKESRQPVQDRPGPAEISRAIARVKSDPNFGTERSVWTLKWKASRRATTSAPSGWVRWIVAFFGWLAESTRVLVWCGLAALAGVLAVYLWRLARRRISAVPSTGTLAVPSYVRDMDIRPEALPDDIGAAARILWDAGEQRDALALLYRGMLSRLVHVHRLPIRESSTEGDCLALAAARMPAGRSDYLASLVRSWQRLGYGHETVENETVYRLCDEFAAALHPL